MSDDTLYLYTSLTAGSSHIVSATSRVETILKANKIPFKAIDCATDDKARLLWGRRSKGRTFPGLVKHGDVIGDLEQIEEWNECGELKDQIESFDDFFGNLPVSVTTAEAQAAAAAAASGAKSETRPRESSETRHISISDPKDQTKESTSSAAASKKDDTPLAMAMRQAGAEAAAKAGQKKAASVSAAKPPEKPATDVDSPAPSAAMETEMKPEIEDSSTENIGGKAPTQLAAEGAMKTSLDKIKSPENDQEVDVTTTKSNEEQLLEQRRKSSVPLNRSSLATQTSISDVPSNEPTSPKPTATESPPTKRRGSSFSEPPTEHRGSSLDSTDQAKIREIEKANAIEEGVEESTDDETRSRQRKDGKNEASKASEVIAKDATKEKIPEVVATDKAEEKATENTKPQEQEAKDEDAAGVSVGD